MLVTSCCRTLQGWCKLLGNQLVKDGEGLDRPSGQAKRHGSYSEADASGVGPEYLDLTQLSSSAHAFATCIT
jgi:hypothetical protein